MQNFFSSSLQEVEGVVVKVVGVVVRVVLVGLVVLVVLVFLVVLVVRVVEDVVTPSQGYMAFICFISSVDNPFLWPNFNDLSFNACIVSRPFLENAAFP